MDNVQFLYSFYEFLGDNNMFLEKMHLDDLMILIHIKFDCQTQRKLVHDFGSAKEKNVLLIISSKLFLNRVMYNCVYIVIHCYI